MNFKKAASIAVTAGLLSSVALPALAETTFYGSARVWTGWDTNKSGDTSPTQRDHGKSQTDFDLRNMATSRLGIDTKVGNLGGKVEIGLGGNSVAPGTVPGGGTFDLNQSGALIGTGGNSIVYTRHLYGTYKFGIGTLLIGQTWNPYMFASEQVANEENGNANDGTGATYDGRAPQIKFILNNGVYMTVLRPVGISGQNTGKSIYLPKLCIGYEGKTGNFSYGGGVVGQTIKYTTSTQTSESINSIMGYVHARAKFNGFEAYTNLAGGQNLGDMGLSEGKNSSITATGTPTANGINGAAVGANFVDNAYTYSILLGAGYTFSPMLKLNAGIGYANTWQGKNAQGVAWLKHDDKVEGFVNTRITIANGISVTPEFTYRDLLFGANGVREQKDFLYGAKWQFDF